MVSERFYKPWSARLAHGLGSIPSGPTTLVPSYKSYYIRLSTGRRGSVTPRDRQSGHAAHRLSARSTCERQQVRSLPCPPVRPVRPMARLLSYTEKTGVRFLHRAPFCGRSIEAMHLSARQDKGEHYPLPAPFMFQVLGVQRRCTFRPRGPIGRAPVS
jgi:hypothetical protein